MIGVLLVGVLLLAMTAFPLFGTFPDYVEQSFMAQPIMDTVVMVYKTLAADLSLDLPMLKIHPEELGAYFSSVSTNSDYQHVNFRLLDESTCFVCGGEVDFLGYLDNGNGSVSPKFICTSCGRTSDGCQTYEGYHVMYEKCPVALGNQGYRFDCGVWSNNSYHRPGGPCTVCGTE